MATWGRCKPYPMQHRIRARLARPLCAWVARAARQRAVEIDDSSRQNPAYRPALFCRFRRARRHKYFFFGFFKKPIDKPFSACYNIIRCDAAMAQLVEHILGKDEVPGPNPGSSSKKSLVERRGILVFQANSQTPHFLGFVERLKAELAKVSLSPSG